MNIGLLHECNDGDNYGEESGTFITVKNKVSHFKIMIGIFQNKLFSAIYNYDITLLIYYVIVIRSIVWKIGAIEIG